MNVLIAACGLDCAQCPAYIATQADDEQAKERLVAQWRVEYNAPDLTIASVTCDGCINPGSQGRLGSYCAVCQIRACCVEHNYASCASCPDYGCEKLTAFWAMAPQAKVNLDALRLAL